MSESRTGRRARGRRLRVGRIVAVSVAALVLAALALAAFIRLPFGDYLVRRTTAAITVGGHPMNLLVIANNARDAAANKPLGLGSAAGQADVMIVLHVDPLQRGIWAIAIPRDALVAQPGWHNPIPKIKTLFYMGDQQTPPEGPQLTMRAVSALTGLHVDGYLAMNFAGFRDAVDFLGGLDVDVKERLYDPQFAHADFKPGMQHMNGTQALAFVRIRQNAAGNAYRINDYQRMNAEVQVLSLLRAKLLDPKTAPVLLPRFVARMRPDIATNLSSDQLVRLSFAMVGVAITQVPLDSADDSMYLASASIPGVNADGSIEAASYDVLDPAAVCKKLARFGARRCDAGLPPAGQPGATPVTIYGTSDAAQRIRKAGYRNTTLIPTISNQAMVEYPPADPASGWAIARLLRAGGDVTVEPGPTGTAAIVARQ